MIEFTQYLLPMGKRESVTIERPAPIEEKAKALKEKGCKFDIEILRTGMVSMTVEDQNVDEDGPIDMQIVPNGPEVPGAVDALISNAYRRVFIDAQKS